MAHMYAGLLGGFSGRIGNIIGYMMNGQQYIRLAPQKNVIPATTRQMIQREKFSIMTKFMSPLTSFINEVHKRNFRGKPRYHKLFSVNYKEAVTGDYPDLKINYRQVLLTTGSLAAPRGIYVGRPQNGSLDFHWENDSRDNLNANGSDRLYLAFYNEDKKSWEIFINTALREDEFVTADMTNQLGNRLHMYVGFTSPEKRQVSKSFYIGSTTIS